MSTSTQRHTLPIDAKPRPITIDIGETAVLVVDMQNDYGAPGGMFDRAEVDISSIRRAVEPTRKVLQAAPRRGHSGHLAQDGISVGPFGRRRRR